jgi:Tol biopolymer transport system component
MQYESVELFPDGRRLLVTAAQPGRPVRSWIASADGSHLEPLTPEGVRATSISPDNLSYLVVGKGALSVNAISGDGPANYLCDLKPNESVVRWSRDGRYLFLQQQNRRALRITRMTVATGQREPWRELKVPEPGAEFRGRVLLSGDGKAIACSFERNLSNLYLITGPK